jgi:2-dehydropantoate 2-reductase
MNIAVIGIGGVGGYFGGKLTQLLKNDPELHIYFVARGLHLKEIQANDLLLDTDAGQLVCRPTMATDTIAELPPLDYCLICVKGYDLDKVLVLLNDKIDSHTVILPLLNGVDIFERVRKITKKGYLHPACVYIGTHISKPGTVEQRGGACTIILGKDPGVSTDNRSILKLLDAAAIKYKWSADPFVDIWIKFLFIAPFGLVTANFNKTNGEVLQSAELSDCARAIMQEITALAEKKGIPLPEDIIETTFAMAAKFPFDLKTSFQRDFEVPGKPDERDLFGGSIIRMGRELGVETRVTEEIYREIMRKKPV